MRIERALTRAMALCCVCVCFGEWLYQKLHIYTTDGGPYSHPASCRWVEDKCLIVCERIAAEIRQVHKSSMRKTRWSPGMPGSILLQARANRTRRGIKRKRRTGPRGPPLDASHLAAGRLLSLRPEFGKRACALYISLQIAWRNAESSPRGVIGARGRRVCGWANAGRSPKGVGSMPEFHMARANKGPSALCEWHGLPLDVVALAFASQATSYLHPSTRA